MGWKSASVGRDACETWSYWRAMHVSGAIIRQQKISGVRLIGTSFVSIAAFAVSIQRTVRQGELAFVQK